MKNLTRITLLLAAMALLGNVIAQEVPKAETPAKKGLFSRLKHNRMSISDKGTSKGTKKAAPPINLTPGK
jgi:hypothetical protein